MKIKFIANACAIFESDKGTKILSDPWIQNGVFEGSWCHFHKLETSIEDLQDVDAIYVSHIHPDHYDERFFNFSKEIPIIVLDHGFNFLHKKHEIANELIVNSLLYHFNWLIKLKSLKNLELISF